MSLQVWLPLMGNLENKGINNLSITGLGTVAYEDAGKIGKCFISGGTSQVTNGININNNLLNILNSPEGSSIALWVKPVGNHVHYNGTFISSGNWNATRWSFGVSQNNTQVDVLSKGHNQYINCTVPVNEWTHLTGVFKNGVSKVYKNGVYVGELTGLPAFDSDATNTCIGRETYASGYFGFNGRINDVRIYNHALSDLEIKEISQGLVLHYKLDNTNCVDSSGYNYNGTAGGTLVLSNDTPRYSSSLTFNGTNNYVSSPTPNFIKPDRYTMSCWVYTDTIPSNSQYIFNCVGVGGTGFWFNNSRLEIKHANVAGASYVYPYATITTGWHFITGTFDGSSVKLYVDGVLESTVVANTIIYNSPSWVIGGNADDGYATGNWFNGKVSDVRLYATALSEADIINLYKTSSRIDNFGNLHNYEVNELSDFLTNVHGYWDWGIYSNYNYGNGGYNSSSGASTYIVGPGLPTRLYANANTVYLTSPSDSAVLSPLVPTETKKYDVDIRFRAGNLTYQNNYTGFKITIDGTDYFLNDAVNADLITNLDVGQNPNPTYAEYDLSTFAINGNASGGKWQSFWVKFRLIKGEFSAIKVGCSTSSKPGDGLTITASIPDLGVGIRTEGKDGTTNFNLTLTESITQATDYTLMCNVAGMPKDSSWTFLVGGSTNTDLSINLHEGFNICHFTANVFSFGTNRLILSDTSGPRTSTVTFSKFLLKKDSTSQIINNIVDGNVDNVNINVKQSGLVNASQFVEGSDKTRFFSGGTAYINEIKEV